MKEEASILPIPFALRVNHALARRRGVRVVRGLAGTGGWGSALIEFEGTVDHEAKPDAAEEARQQRREDRPPQDDLRVKDDREREPPGAPRL